MNETYVLDSAGNPQLEPDLIKWAEWFEECGHRRLALTEIEGVRISTVFLGLDYSFTFQGPPILWETMVFGGELDQEQNRYATREQALAGHEEMVEKGKTFYSPPRKVLSWRRSHRRRKGLGKGWGASNPAPPKTVLWQARRRNECSTENVAGGHRKRPAPDAAGCRLLFLILARPGLCF